MVAILGFDLYSSRSTGKLWRGGDPYQTWSMYKQSENFIVWHGVLSHDILGNRSELRQSRSPRISLNKESVCPSL
jgi:hypothetical protein